MAVLKLDHNQKEISKAFGLSDYDAHYVKAAIVFETISSHLKVAELFDSVDEAPKEITSISGVLEQVLTHATSSVMRDFMLLSFRQGYEGTIIAIEAMMEDQKSKDNGPKEGEDPMRYFLMGMIKRIKTHGLKTTIAVVKECNYNWNKFVERVLPEGKFEERFREANDIDNMLKDILGGQDDD